MAEAGKQKMRKLKKQIILNLFILLTPLVTALLLYNFHGFATVTEHVANAGKNVVEIYDRLLEQDLDQVQYYLSNKLSNDEDTLSLNYSRDYLDAYLTGESILSDFNQFLQSGFDSVYAMAVCAKEQGMFRIHYHNYDSSTDYQTNLVLRQKIQTSMMADEAFDWYVVNVGEKNFLVQVLSNQNVAFAAVVDLERVAKPQDYVIREQQGYLFYTDASYQPLILKEFAEENGIVLKASDELYYISGNQEKRFMVVQKAFRYAQLNQVYVLPYSTPFPAFDLMQVVLFLLTLGVAAMIPIGYSYMKRSYVVPVERLVETMSQIKDGDSDKYLEEEYQIEEFCRMKTGFNEMLKSIRELKISAYEQKIRIQNARLQYLQIQIRPHFFQNCLKNIYALSVSGENEKLQRMILVLSGYLRGIIRKEDLLITLKDEISSVRNYLELQAMSLAREPEYTIEVDEALQDILIPPLTILTFVENSVKHGMSNDKRLVISIRVSELCCEEERFLSITVLDNGAGFPEQVLDKLNRSEGTLGKEHIGINNVKQRIQVLYHNRATLLFGNSDGAYVEMILPVKEDGKHDSFDSR